MDTLEIEFLPEKEWKGYLLPLDYESRECYDVRIDEERDMTVSFVRTALATPFVHRDSECAFPARLYEDYYEKAEAYGIRKGRKLLAAIELCQESWSNRMRVTNIYVDPALRRKGIGSRLMDLAKTKAREHGNRGVILETQTSNVPAIDFYKSQGFQIGGFDRTCYGNDDVERREVRLELYFPLDTGKPS